VADGLRWGVEPLWAVLSEHLVMVEESTPDDSQDGQVGLWENGPHDESMDGTELPVVGANGASSLGRGRMERNDL